jgi:truncated hemoglobin YjbI
VLFLGRRVYWGGVIVVATALHQQREEGYSVRKIMDLFGVTLSTFRRWLAFFRSAFPRTPTWQRLRGLLVPPVAAEAIPLGVLERLGLGRDGPETALVRCLRLLAGCGF